MQPVGFRRETNELKGRERPIAANRTPCSPVFIILVVVVSDPDGTLLKVLRLGLSCCCRLAEHKKIQQYFNYFLHLKFQTTTLEA